jgi:hypothetical protein
MLYTYLYLIDIIPQLNIIIVTTVIVALILLFLAYAVECTVKETFIITDKQLLNKLIKPAAVTCAAASLLWVLLPSQTVMYEWAGVYITKQIAVETKAGDKLKKISDIIDIKLEQIKKELENESNTVK